MCGPTRELRRGSRRPRDLGSRLCQRRRLRYTRRPHPLSLGPETHLEINTGTPGAAKTKGDSASSVGRPSPASPRRAPPELQASRLLTGMWRRSRARQGRTGCPTTQRARLGAGFTGQPLPGRQARPRLPASPRGPFSPVSTSPRAVWAPTPTFPTRHPDASLTSPRDVRAERLFTRRSRTPSLAKRAPNSGSPGSPISFFLPNSPYFFLQKFIISL